MYLPYDNIPPLEDPRKRVQQQNQPEQHRQQQQQPVLQDPRLQQQQLQPPPPQQQPPQQMTPTPTPPPPPLQHYEPDRKALSEVESYDGSNRIFIPRVDPVITNSDLESYFMQFGKVLSVVISPGRRFGFIEMESPSLVTQILKIPNHFVKNIDLELSRGLPRDGASPHHANRIFINSIPHGTTDGELKQFFSQFGTVEDAHQPGFKGYGFCSFSSHEEMEAAMSKSPIPFKGKLLKLEYAKRKGDDNNNNNNRHQHQQQQRRRRLSPSPQARSWNKDNRIYMKGVPNDCTEEDIREYFENFVTVDNVFFPQNQRSDMLRFGFVSLRDQESVNRCLSMTHVLTKFNDAVITVARAKKPKALNSNSRYRSRSRSPPPRRRHDYRHRSRSPNHRI